jgi:hypothetical protein
LVGQFLINKLIVNNQAHKDELKNSMQVSVFFMVLNNAKNLTYKSSVYIVSLNLG